LEIQLQFNWFISRIIEGMKNSAVLFVIRNSFVPASDNLWSQIRIVSLLEDQSEDQFG